MQYSRHHFRRILKPLFAFLCPCSGLIEYALESNTLIGGDDFKSGQTKLKSVLVDFLVSAGLKVSETSHFTPSDMWLATCCSFRHHPGLWCL